MKPLSGSVEFGGPICRVPALWELIRVRDRLFAIEGNSFQVYRLDSEGEFPSVQQLKEVLLPQISLALPPIMCVVLEATHRCNLKCKYCFVQEYSEREGVMGLEVAQEAVVRFMRREDKNPSIGFFGGEPLLNWELIEGVVAFGRGYFHPNRPRYNVTTNLTLVDEEKARFLAREGFGFIGSLDGPEDLHNQYRGQSFYRALRGLEYLSAAMKGVGTLRATFTKRSTQVRRRVEYLNSLCDKGMGGHVSVEPVTLCESSCIGKDQEGLAFSPEDVKGLEGEYLDCADWFVDRLRSGKKARFHHFYKPIERILHRIYSPTECGAGQGYLSVAWNGDVFACHRELHTKVGNLYQGGIDECLRCKWVDNRWYARKNCPSCAIHWICGGGCREASIMAGSDIALPNPVECEFHRLFVRGALWIMSEVPREVLEANFPDPRGRRSGAGSPGQRGRRLG